MAFFRARASGGSAQRPPTLRLSDHERTLRPALPPVPARRPLVLSADGRRRPVRYSLAMAEQEPRPPRPPRPSRGDVALALVGVVLVALEGTFREALPLRPVQVAAALVLVATLAPRRVRPFESLVVAFVVANALTLVAVLRETSDLGLYSSILVLLHPYSLVRLGTRREIAVGLGVVAATWAISLAAGEMNGAEDVIGSFTVLSLPAALGAAVRFRDLAHRHDVERAKLRERQMLARELHDTIGHHLSAIVVQAQAAQVVSKARPEKVDGALTAIEGEASRSLAELRALVGALRDDVSTDLAPLGGTEAIAQLVRDVGEHATFEREGDLERLAPSVDLALHRIAREALHNAARHAQGATRIEVHLSSEADRVRLRVRDDGKPVGSPRAGGFGLVGMKERAVLLGGTFAAGPRPAGGFEVEVVLPRAGVRA